MLQARAAAMIKRTYEGQNCSIGARVGLVSECWTLLIIRDALLGVRRFDEFQENLGIARCSPARSDGLVQTR
jgi:DNA-binding HxlR family transcriptional regulator